MKAGRLIELLEGVSPDAEVMCCISTDDLEEVTNMTLADFNALKKYEIFVVLNSDEDEEFCRLLLKKKRILKMIRECIHCKKSRGLGSDVWCSEGHPYESYMRETDCPYFEPYDDD